MTLSKYRMRNQAPKGKMPYYETIEGKKIEEPTETGFRIRRGGVGFEVKKVPGGFDIIPFRDCWQGWDDAERAVDLPVYFRKSERLARNFIGERFGR